MPAPLRFTCLSTPLGEMVAAASDSALCLLEFTDRRMLETQLSRLQKRTAAILVESSNSVIEQTEAELSDYFSGSLRQFRVPLEPAGTEFQRKVWQILTTIPYGMTRSYGAQALAVGNPDAIRAVARANGDNPIAIIVPCHRVIGTDGKLTGYGGGLWRKRWLLDHESGGALPL